MTKKRAGAGRPRKPRVLRARPLLIAVGAAACLAGCGDDTTATVNVDMGIPAMHDMGLIVVDLGKPPTD